jgi:hypothetical protein
MKKRIGAVSIIVMALVLAACGSGESSSSSASAENTFGLSEFTIIPPANALHPGSVSITGNNVGSEVHELVLVRAASVDSLPKKPDGSVDEDKIADADKVGEIENVASQSHKSKTFELAAGAYVAFCNIVDTMMGSSSSMMNGSGMMNGTGMGSGTGHVHFAEGMRLAFTVS